MSRFRVRGEKVRHSMVFDDSGHVQQSDDSGGTRTSMTSDVPVLPT